MYSASDLDDYDPYEETDGGGYISLKANRVFLWNTFWRMD
jgi:hypothetical protein